MLIKNYIFLCILFFLKLFAWGNINSEQKSTPKGIFTAVFWEKYKSEFVKFAPWGNDKEENATLLDLSVSSDNFSRKFVFYGEENLRFYNTKILDEYEVLEETVEEGDRMGKAFAEFKLTNTNQDILEYVLVFLGKNKNGIRKIYPIPFTQKDVPLGSFQFVSQSTIPLYIEFGKEKFVLSPRKTKLVRATSNDGEKVISMRVTIVRNGRKEEVFKQRARHFTNLRGMFFMGFGKDGISVRKFSEFESPIDRSLGYGTPSKSSPIKTEEVETESNK